jgi:protein-S-isoprenylcysteine O-methyltransferase Ste14
MRAGWVMRNLLIVCMVFAALFWGGMAYATVLAAGFNGGTVFYAFVGLLFEVGLGFAYWHTRTTPAATSPSVERLATVNESGPAVPGQHEDA